jgi:hypothetical protein
MAPMGMVMHEPGNVSYGTAPRQVPNVILKHKQQQKEPGVVAEKNSPSSHACGSRRGPQLDLEDSVNCELVLIRLTRKD